MDFRGNGGRRALVDGPVPAIDDHLREGRLRLENSGRKNCQKKQGESAQVPADHCVTPFGPAEDEDLTGERRGRIESDLKSNCRTEVLSRQTIRKKMRGQLSSGVTLRT